MLVFKDLRILAYYHACCINQGYSIKVGNKYPK